MEEMKKTVSVFLASDGKEFLNQEDCVKYENTTLKQLENIKYFKYFTSRDCNETGMFYHHNYAAVYISGYDSCYKEVLLQFLLGKYNGKILSYNVQGYGVTSMFEICEISKDVYLEKKPNTWGGSDTDTEQILLSEIPIDGFPKNIKVISEYVDNYK